MDTISIRIKNSEELDCFGKKMREKRSDLIRNLIEEGKKMRAMKLYKEKR